MSIRHIHPRHVLFLAVCCLGVSAFATQLVLMRELLAVFSGNELTFGVVLGNWMLLTGLGSTLGRHSHRARDPVALLIVAQILIALLPPTDVFLLRWLRNVIFLRGAAIGWTETVLGSMALLAPYCILTGYLLTLSCRLLAERQGPESIGRVYFLDVVGDILGGVLFSFVLVVWLDHFQCLYVPAAINLLAALLVAVWHNRRWLALCCLGIGGASAAVAAGVDLEAVSTRLQYPGQEVVFHGNSPYGRLIVTRNAGQYTFIENGVVLFSTQNIEQIEETVHFAMAQRPQAESVLLIGGGVTGTACEILKYPRARVDYVELDPLVVRVARTLLPGALSDERIEAIQNDGRVSLTRTPRGIEVIQSDGRFWVKQTSRRYDVVIVDVPEPSTSQLNCYYTREFFAEVSRVLRPEGVLSFQLGQYDDYIGPELAQLLAATHRTLREVFPHALILPGTKNVFLASQGSLTEAVADGIESAGVSTRWMTRPYLRSVLSADRMADLQRVLDVPAAVNRDFNPILYYYHLRYWMTQFKVRFGLLEGGLLVLLAIYLLRIRPVPLVVFSAGLTASVLQVVLLLGFQILYGSVYQRVALIVAAFMLGLGLGSLLMNRRPDRRSPRDLAILGVAVAVIAIAVPGLLMGLDRLGTEAGPGAASILIPTASLVVAMLVGLQFPLAGRLLTPASVTAGPQQIDTGELSATASSLYTADYLGSALGALLVSTLLIPLIGVVGVCLLTAGLNVLSALILIGRH